MLVSSSIKLISDDCFLTPSSDFTDVTVDDCSKNLSDSDWDFRSVTSKIFIWLIMHLNNYLKLEKNKNTT